RSLHAASCHPSAPSPLHDATPAGDPGAVSREGPRTAQLAKGCGPWTPGMVPCRLSPPSRARLRLPLRATPAEAAHEDGEAVHGTAWRQCGAGVPAMRVMGLNEQREAE